MVKKELTEQEQIAKELEQWVRKMRCTGSTGIKLGKNSITYFRIRFALKFFFFNSILFSSLQIKVIESLMGIELPIVVRNEVLILKIRRGLYQ